MAILRPCHLDQCLKVIHCATLSAVSYTHLKAGDSIVVNAVYQIPDFGGWASANLPGNAKRLFTLRVIKQDASSYKPDEDSNIENNVADDVVFYRDLTH